MSVKTAINVDLTAPVNLAIMLQGASGGIVTVTITQNGAVLPIAGATIKYQADTTIPIIKTVGAGVTVTGVNVFQIAFVRLDTATQNTAQRVQHECKLTLPGGEPLPVFVGYLQVVPSIYTTATV